MINRKEISMHIYSVFAVVLVLSAFFILGGGENANGETDDGGGQALNLNVPDAKASDMADDRLDAQRRAILKAEEDERVDRLQHNSFEFFKGDSGNSHNRAPQKVSSPSSGKKTRVSVNDIVKSGGVSDNVTHTVSSKEEAKARKMRDKRAQIERELGIDLSEYGYDKYKEEESVPGQPEDENVIVNLESSQAEGGFFGLDSEEEEYSGDIKAVIHGDHNDMTSGSIIKMRLLEDVDIDGTRVPRNTFVYGRLSFKSGRAAIRVENINYRGKILKFPASIYDTDGFEGLYVPDNVVNDTKNKVASDIVGGIDIDVSSKSKFINTASSAVASTVKNAIQGSVRESKISISSNYSITIKRQRK